MTMADELVIEDDESYEDQTNEDLREELDARDLPTSGNKDELVARLESDYQSEEDTVAEDENDTTVIEGVALDEKNVGNEDADEVDAEALPGYARTVNPSYGEPRNDGLVGVGEDYPAQASRSGDSDAEDSDES